MTDVSLLSAARTFGEQVVSVQSQNWERERTMPREVLEAAAGAGLMGLLVPREEGGYDLSLTTTCELLRTLASSDFALTFCLIVHNNLMSAIARRGTEEQRRRHLGPMLDGSRLGAFLLTEPSGGSDPAALEMSASRVEGGWRLNGQKSWVTNARHADLLSVYARAADTEERSPIAAFLVDSSSPGVRRLPIYELLGGHALGAGGFEFEDVFVADADVLAPPGEGLGAALGGIDLARICVAAMCCGMLERALEEAIEHAKTHRLFGSRLADLQGKQWQLAEVSTQLRAAELLTHDAATRFDEGRATTVAAAHAKKHATRTALAGLSECMQTLGANGLKQNRVLARHFACAKIAQYLDGATEIQDVVISRHLFAD